MTMLIRSMLVLVDKPHQHRTILLFVYRKKLSIVLLL